MHRWLSTTLVLALLAFSVPASAVSSAELYQNQTYTYGRFEARVRFAVAGGVVRSFFLWKPGFDAASTMLGLGALIARRRRAWSAAWVTAGNTIC